MRNEQPYKKVYRKDTVAALPLRFNPVAGRCCNWKEFYYGIVKSGTNT